MLNESLSHNHHIKNFEINYTREQKNYHSSTVTTRSLHKHHQKKQVTCVCFYYCACVFYSLQASCWVFSGTFCGSLLCQLRGSGTVEFYPCDVAVLGRWSRAGECRVLWVLCMMTQSSVGDSAAATLSGLLMVANHISPWDYCAQEKYCHYKAL